MSSDLSDAEIRLKLTQLGYPIGPVTATTRKVLLKKLKHLTDQLKTQESDKKDLKKSLTRYSSEEESEDDAGLQTRNRRSMPPPASPKSPPKSVKRSLSRVSQDVSSNTLQESTNSAFTLPSASSTLNHNDASSIFSGFNTAKYSPTNNKFTSPSKSKFSTYTSQYTRKSLGLGLESLDQDSESEGVSEFESGCRLTSHKSPFSLNRDAGSNVFTRSRYVQPSTESDGLNYKSSWPNNDSPSSSPFSSEFVRKLTAASPSNRSGLGAGLPPRLLDVKESDDEDLNSISQYSQQSIGSTRKGRAHAFEGKIWKNASYLSVILLLLFGIFFCALAVVYLSKRYKEAPISISDANLPICKLGEKPGATCILSDEVQLAMNMFRNMYQVLHDKAVQHACTSDLISSALTADQLTQLLVDKLGVSVWDIEKHFGNIRVLIGANPQWGVEAFSNSFNIPKPSLPLGCYIISFFYGIVGTALRIILGGAALLLFARVGFWWVDRKERTKKEVFKMVESIIEVLSSLQPGNTGDNYIPISHVRDQLIPPHQRDKMANVWNKAVAYLEANESRVRTEEQQVQGEECYVWRWLSAPRSNGKRKVWQGQAFETMEGSVNSLAVSPTPCLKIRHMFDSDGEAEEDWMTRIRDAILEKCEGIDVLHITVDKNSNEGCVYMKCGSSKDAGRAYRALHGSWFDSKLVTVKYLRLERYHERFPEAVRAVRPLVPSNDRKLSLQ